MPKFRTVCLFNTLPPNLECGAFSASAFSTLERLVHSREWTWRCFCGAFNSGISSETFFPILSRMSGGTFDLRLWRGYRMLSAHGIASAKKMAEMSRFSDAFLVLNPTGLSTLEWMLAISQARVVIPWIDSDWPRDFPACDPFWTLSLRHRHSINPATLIASALIRSLYGELHPTMKNFCCIRTAIFATENLRTRNASMFTHLERSVVIAPAVDSALFPFFETSPARSCVWGWNGGFTESSGVFIILDAFARQAACNPQMRLLLSGDETSPEADVLRARISFVSGLAACVVFVGTTSRERLARDFFHQIGLYAFIPKDESAFPLEAAEAMACGCLVFSSFTEEMNNLASSEIPLLFNRQDPETALFVSDLIAHLSQEEWALIAADCATRVQERCSPSRTESALAEFIETAATFSAHTDKE